MTTRRFGIEIEAFGITRQAALQALQNIGIHACCTGYTHSTTPYWKILEDGSIRSSNPNLDGWELVSPILHGEEGLAEVARVAKALAQAGAKVDRRCGFHVHVDAAGMQPDEIRTTVERYAAFEDGIDQFMPNSRRGNNNQYCYSVQRLLNYYSWGPSNRMSSFLQAFQGDNQSRFHKVNLHAYVRHGTVEFRQHSGTCNAEKMVNWIRFCVAFVETSCEIAATLRTAPVPPSYHPTTVTQRATARERAADYTGYYDLTCAQRQVLERLLQGSASVQDLCAAAACSRNGWRGITPQTLFSYISEIRTRCGVAIKKQRNGSYSIENSSTTVVQAEVVPYSAHVDIRATDSLFRGIPADVSSFYAERAQDFTC